MTPMYFLPLSSVFLAPQPAGKLTVMQFVAMIHRIWDFTCNYNDCFSLLNP